MRQTAAIRGMAILTVWCASAVRLSAQDLPEPAPVEPPVPAAPSTRQLEKRFRSGRELIEAESYAEGTRFLQSVLESDEDDFFSPDAENRQRERSLKAEALSLLGGMPTAGREVYERQYGPISRRLLSEAIARSDADQLGAITRRFFHTQAGYEAAYRLAADHLDHGRPLAAALTFERLRSTPQADDQFEPLLSLKTALSWQRAGRDDKALEILVALKRKHRGPSIVLGGRDTALFDDPSRALAWLTRTLGLARPRDRDDGAHGWLMPGGNVRHNAESAGGSPYLRGGWRASTVTGSTASAETDAEVAKSIAERRRPPGAADQPTTPMVPSLQPLVVDDLVVVRSIGDLRAYDLKSGKLAWSSLDKDRLLQDLARGAGPTTQVPGIMPLTLLVAERLWGDATFGTIVSDGELVFSIEDLGLGGPSALLGPRQPLARDYTRLVALDVRTGQLVWEVGGPRTDAADALAGVFFLGPPLVLDRRLYALVEAGTEVRLVVLEPRTGKLLWSQALNDGTDIVWEAFRRQCGLTPSFDGGILICPTGSNQVTAVDVTGRSLLWRYRLRSWAETYDPRQQQIIAPQQAAVIRLQANGWIDQNRWLDSAAILSDSRVLLALRDSSELHCVNLIDGTLAWKAPRADGLFVAGVREGRVIVVGRTFVHALKMEDGQPAWSRPATISVPSGRGFIVGDRLHLPLSTAEVATIDLRDGRVVARTQSAGKDVPGNLVGLRGTVVSQGADFVEAFQQLETLDAEVGVALAADPADANALALRGQMRLQRGELAGAYADLERALTLKPDDAGLRSLFADSLLEGLRVDYPAYRALNVDFDRVFADPRQHSAYLWLCATGLARTGQAPAAFETLLRFAAPDIADGEHERLDATLTVRRDRLVQSFSARVYAEAAPADRARIDASVRNAAERLLEEGSPAEKRRFLDYFGDQPEARELARSVALLPDTRSWLADELLLRRFDAAPEPRLAAAATAGYAALLLGTREPRDALPFLAKIEREWPEVPSLGGKPGREVVAAWRERPELGPARRSMPSWPTGKVLGVRKENGFQSVSPAYAIQIEGDRRPFFVDRTVEISSRSQDFVARDAFGRQVWKVALESSINSAQVGMHRAYLRDHLMVIAAGSQVVAIDTLGTADAPGARVLWRMNLIESPGPGFILPRLARGRRGMQFNPLTVELATVGPITRNSVTVLKGSRLMVLDPLTGKPLWTREGMVPGSDLYGDEELLFVLPAEAPRADAYRILDGQFVGQRAVPPVSERLEIVGRMLVVWRNEGAGKTLLVRDLSTERTVWQREFSPKASAMVIESSEIAVVEPEGRFTILALADGTPVLRAVIEPVRELEQILVTRSSEQYLLFANERPDWDHVVDPGSGRLYVNGRVYGFDRATGKSQWPPRRIERQGYDPHQPSGLPIVVFYSQAFERAPNAAVGTNRVYLQCLDRRTGRIVYSDERTNQGFTHFDIVVHPEEPVIDLRMLGSTVSLTFTDKPWE